MTNKIKQLRLERGWTQKELGSRFKKPKPPELISRWENDVSVPSALSLMELSKIFNVPFAELFD